jgi:hypothetical protein
MAEGLGMTWPGKTYIGSDAPSVRLGDALVSKKVEWGHNGDNGHPDVVMRFEVRDGRPECVGIVITAKPDGRGIQTSDLEDLRIDPRAQQAFRHHAFPITDDQVNVQRLAADMAPTDPDYATVDKSVHEARHGQRKPVARAELETVARVYRTHVAGNPTRAVQEWFQYSPRTAARRIRQARDAGLLPDTTKGKKKG